MSSVQAETAKRDTHLRFRDITAFLYSVNEAVGAGSVPRVALRFQSEEWNHRFTQINADGGEDRRLKLVKVRKVLMFWSFRCAP